MYFARKKVIGAFSNLNLFTSSICSCKKLIRKILFNLVGKMEVVVRDQVLTITTSPLLRITVSFSPWCCKLGILRFFFLNQNLENSCYYLIIAFWQGGKREREQKKKKSNPSMYFLSLADSVQSPGITWTLVSQPDMSMASTGWMRWTWKLVPDIGTLQPL